MKRWRRYVPYLYLNIDFNILRITTGIVYESFEAHWIEYIMLYIEVFHKPIWRFKLYDTFERRCDR